MQAVAAARPQESLGADASAWNAQAPGASAPAVGLGFSVDTDKRRQIVGPRETVQLWTQTKAQFFTL